MSEKYGSVGGIQHKSGFIAFPTCNPRSVDETRLHGESWLDMRNRTQQERDAISDEVKANACLIAAAPELLEALAACEQRLTYLAQESAPVIAELKLAREAIAKATGEQS